MFTFRVFRVGKRNLPVFIKKSEHSLDFWLFFQSFFLLFFQDFFNVNVIYPFVCAALYLFCQKKALSFVAFAQFMNDFFYTSKDPHARLFG